MGHVLRRGPARFVPILAVAATALFWANPALGQDQDVAALAKEVQNPLANLVTFPFQANMNNNVGPFERRLTNLNIQPVIPFPGEKWNIIARTILPYVSIPRGENDVITGFGDMTLTLFWSPAKPGAVIWGAGPVAVLPTASSEQLGSDKLSLGPSGVIFWGPGKWTLGVVANNVWSTVGQSDAPSVSRFFAQWFVNFNFGGGWALGTAPIITCDWKAASGNQCVIPIGLQGSKVLMFGTMPVNLLVGYYKNLEHPVQTADEQLRIQINLMFPQKPK